MDLFSIYFAGSPIKFVVMIVVLSAILISFIRGKQKVWRPVKLSRPNRIYISLLIMILVVMSNINIGHRQKDLHRDSFDTPMAKEAPEKIIEVQKKFDADKAFKDQLEKSRQENSK